MSGQRRTVVRVNGADERSEGEELKNAATDFTHVQYDTRTRKRMEWKWRARSGGLKTSIVRGGMYRCRNVDEGLD